MTDLAFDNYCINCEKLCGGNSIYCSDECKLTDEKNTQLFNNAFNTGGYQSQINSPLITSPNYAFLSNPNYGAYEDINSISLDSIDELNLNYYSINNSSKNDNNVSLVSTSNNYKKWLTGTCL